jgi:putative (di)nucleoside polyphosphate hydrolase
MLEKYKNLPLRNGVGIVLLNNKNKVFVGKRIDNPINFWQMPQGGINKNEQILDAAKRELREETGITKVELIKELNYWLTYELPNNLIGKIWKGKYRGQKQKWFIMKFVGNAENINIKTKYPEFLDWKWVEPSKLPDIVVGFKIKIYNKLVEEIVSLKLG